jgi:1-acyl-sn-glycerol-3-phosphate acyltransferase
VREETPKDSHSLAQRVWYNLIRYGSRIVALVIFRYRSTGRENIPASGGALVLSNHQSHLDPVLVGISVKRRLNYLARDTLFKFAPFRWLINSLDAIPIARDGVGMSGLNETLKRLKNDQLVLIFPEGTRSHDGQMLPLKPGFCSIARRSKTCMLPVGIAGAYEAWPRTRNFPLPGKIHVHFGPPITPEFIATLDDDALLIEVDRRIHECQAFAEQQSLARRSS